MILIYLSSLWLITVIITVYDKIAAKKPKGKKKSKKLRVPEKTLWTLAFLGAALPEYVTMVLIRHKTKHKSFMWGLPAVAVLNFALFIAYIIVF